MSDHSSRELFIAGIDEAGRGPLAGPVTAAAVVLPVGYHNDKIQDSKKLTALKRETVFDEIREVAIAYAIVSVGSRRIETLNIRGATLRAMELCAKRVEQQLPGAQIKFLIDGNMPLGNQFYSEAIIGGDAIELSISAASILAKVTRDRLMDVLNERYPGYEFAKHKGYPTKLHLEKISLLQPSRVHRRTFRGVREHITAAFA